MKTIKKLFLNEKGTYSFECDHTDIHNSLISDCGRFYYDSRYKPSESFLIDRGFYISGTGGGCTAWRQEFYLGEKSIYMLITNLNLSHECENNEEMIFGLFELEEDEPIISWTTKNEITIHNPKLLPYEDMTKIEQEQADNEQLAMEALDLALGLIQKRIGIETGDYASNFFDNTNIVDQFMEYIKDEKINKKGLL